MIKRNKLSILALSVATILIFTACSQDAYTGFFNLMGGNVYSDNLGIALPGESADGAIQEVFKATEATLDNVNLSISDSEVSELESGGEVNKQVTLSNDAQLPVAPSAPLEGVVKKDSDIDSSYVNNILSATDKKIVVIYKENGETQIPKFEDKTDSEKEALTSSLTTSNEKAKEALKESLNELSTDKLTLLAAHNTSLIIESGMSSINSNLVDSSSDSTLVLEVKAQLRDLTNKLIPKLPDNPTKGDILQLQLSYNLINSLNNAFVEMKTKTGETDLNNVDFQTAAMDLDVVEKLEGVIKDANAAIAVANLTNQNGELIESLDIGSIINQLTATSSSKGISLTDSEKAKINSRIKELSPTIAMFMKSYIGIKKEGEVYVYDSSLREENKKSNLEVYKMFLSYFSINSMASSENTALKTSLASYSNFVGIDGLETYFLSFLSKNLDSSLESLLTYYNSNRIGSAPEYASVESFINGYLANHTQSLDSIFNNTDIDVMKLYYIDSDSTKVDPILESISGGINDFESYDLIKNMISQDALNQFVDNCKIILNNTPGADSNEILKQISNALNDFKESIANYYI